MGGVVYAQTGTRDLNVLRGLLNPQRGLPLTGSLMIIGVMASAGIPGMAGFISEFLIFRGSLQPFPVATLLSMVGSGLTAVYFLLIEHCLSRVNSIPWKFVKQLSPWTSSQ